MQLVNEVMDLIAEASGGSLGPDCWGGHRPTRSLRRAPGPSPRASIGVVTAKEGPQRLHYGWVVAYLRALREPRVSCALAASQALPRVAPLLDEGRRRRRREVLRGDVEQQRLVGVARLRVELEAVHLSFQRVQTNVFR
jgi:hypothetical protein